MPFADQMIAGLQLMLLGMSTVFVFLIVLVFTLRGMSLLAAKLAPDDEVASPGISIQRVTPGAGNSELIAVISAAITRFRNR